ncbi:MAG: hypothetical protein HY901_18055 [Deltaproteobacteria bacterium]|nr:hypothetical protein [Deltaproteobacteria bacterium]
MSFNVKTVMSAIDLFTKKDNGKLDYNELKAITSIADTEKLRSPEAKPIVNKLVALYNKGDSFFESDQGPQLTRDALHDVLVRAGVSEARLGTAKPTEPTNTGPVCTDPDLKSFNASKYADEGYGDKADLKAVFGSTPKYAQVKAQDAEIKFMKGGKYAPQLTDAGMTKQMLEAVRDEFREVNGGETDGVADFQCSQVTKLFDAQKRFLGFMVRASNDEGSVGGNVFVSPQGKCDGTWGD